MPSVQRVKRPWLTDKPAQTGQGRQNPNRDVYDTRRWRKLRMLVLTANPFCVSCKASNRLTQATVCDHINPINNGGDPWDEKNLQQLCSRCHARKSRSERDLAKPKSK